MNEVIAYTRNSNIRFVIRFIQQIFLEIISKEQLIVGDKIRKLKGLEISMECFSNLCTYQQTFMCIFHATTWGS